MACACAGGSMIRAPCSMADLFGHQPRWGSIRFRPAPRTYAPWGCIVRVVSQTKSRKIPTRKTLPLFFVRRLQYGTHTRAAYGRGACVLACGGTDRVGPRHVHRTAAAARIRDLRARLLEHHLDRLRRLGRLGEVGSVTSNTRSRSTVVDGEQADYICVATPTHHGACVW